MSRLAAPLLAVSLIAGTAAQAAHPAGTHRVAIEYQDLTGSQDMSSAPWVTHADGAHIFQEGQKASLLIQVLAEDGNPEFILGTAVGDQGKTFGDAAVGLPQLPKHSRRVVLTVDAKHPRISGAWMLGRTNDGFAGIDSFDASHLTKPVTIEVYGLDAGTEKDTEAKADLAFQGGLGRTPEDGVIARHKGIVGNADIPADAKWDTAKPVGRVTFTPLP